MTTAAGQRAARDRVPAPRSSPIGVLVCDDQVWAGAALAESFRRRGWMAWSATTRRGAEQCLAEDVPEVCLLEERLLTTWGATGLREMLHAHPRTTAIVLATRAATGVDALARSAGASGLVHRHRDLTTLVDQMQVLGRTGRLPTATMSRDHPLASRRGPLAPRTPSPYALLTARQRAVLACLCEGLGTEEIAAQLGISVTTTRTHVQRMLSTLGAHSRLEAVALMRRPDADRRGTRP